MCDSENPWADGEWHEGTVTRDEDEDEIVPFDGDDDDMNKWIPVIMAAIVAGATVLICLVCGETITSVASIIGGKS